MTAATGSRYRYCTVLVLVHFPHLLRTQATLKPSYE